MNIRMLLDAHDYDGDLRLSAEARRSIDDGHHVVVCDHAAGRRRHEVRDGVEMRRWQRYQRKAASSADRVIVVVHEARDRMTALGVPVDRITVVSNALTDRFVCRFSAVTKIRSGPRPTPTAS